MKLGSLKGGPDGRLAVVARDLSAVAPAGHVAPTLQAALEDWDACAPALEALYAELNAGRCADARPFRADDMAAPLPRAWQWLDGSVFKAHADLATRAFGLASTWNETPLMYQGMSHRFLGPTDDVPFPDAADGVDFEGEFGIVTGAAPMGVSRAEARGHIRLLIQLNDWSLRAIGREEMARGFGWVRAKPACSVAPVAITPDELGEAWREARVALPLHIWWNGELFGRATGAEMTFGFDDLIAHAAYSRDLCAGTVIGSGTVANTGYRTVGSSCILERRGIEILDHGEPRTGFLKDGDDVRMEARLPDGSAPFGALAQRVRIAR